MIRIDEKSMVPIGWVVSGFAVVFSITVVGAFWVFRVDYRLARIEEKLGIKTVHVSRSADPFSAYAGEEK